MSYVQAHELALWESLFHQCLVSQIEKRLRRTAIIQLSKRKGDHVLLGISHIIYTETGNGNELGSIALTGSLLSCNLY